MKRRVKLFAWWVLAAGCLSSAGPGSYAQEGDVRGVHDPCIIEENGVYYLFCTGRGVPMRRSTDLIHWKDAGQVFPLTPRTTARHTWESGAYCGRTTVFRKWATPSCRINPAAEADARLRDHRRRC